MNKHQKIETPIENSRAHMEDLILLENCNNNRINCIINYIFEPGNAQIPEKYLEQYYDYMSKYTGNNHNSKLEFDTIKYYSNKYNFGYDKIISSYTENYYPASIYAELDEDTIHNLFIAIMEFLAYSKATDNIASGTIDELSDMIASKRFAPDDYMEKTKYRLPEFIDELNYVYDRSDVTERRIPDEFYSDVANRLHYRYSDGAERASNIFTEEQKRKENDKYYYTISNSTINYLSNFIGGKYSDIIKPIIMELFNKIKTALMKRSEEQNSYKYSLDRDNLDFVPKEKIKRLEGTVEMNMPYWVTQWLNYSSLDELHNLTHWNELYDDIDSYINFGAYNKAVPVLNTQPIKSNEEPITNVEIFPEQNLETELVDIEHLKNYPIDFQEGVKEVIIDVLDDYAQLKGFKQPNNQ